VPVSTVPPKELRTSVIRQRFLRSGEARYLLGMASLILASLESRNLSNFYPNLLVQNGCFRKSLAKFMFLRRN